MKKVFKKIGILVLVMIIGLSFFYKPSAVKAKEDRTYVIDIPSTQVDYESFYAHYQHYSEYLMSSLIWSLYEDDNNNHTLLNEDGKSVLVAVNDDMYEPEYYQLYEGATEEDCIYSITDEMRGLFIEYFDYDPFEQYTKVQLVLTEFDVVEDSDTVYLDLGYDNLLDAPGSTYNGMEIIVSDHFSYLGHVSSYDFYNHDGKLLMRLYWSDRSLELGNVSSEDDIEYTLTDEDREAFAQEAGMNLDGYDKIVLKFGNQEYASSYYVLDCTDFDYSHDDNKFWEIIDFFEDKELIPRYSYLERYYDTDGSGLFEIVNDSKIHLFKDLGYDDTITVDISEDEDFLDYLSDKHSIQGINKIVIKFKNPEFIEGQNQEYSPSKDEELSFRLNIPFDKFQESGVVYLDGEVVDPKNYVASEGSTIITFKKDFVSGLDAGNHTVRATVTDGEATTSFRIVEDSPATGDSVLLYLLLLLTGSCGMFVVRKRLS